MRKTFVLCLLMVLVIIGCTTEEASIKKYDKSNLFNEIMDLNFDIQPKLPTKIPFEVQGFFISFPPPNNKINVKFLSESSDEIKLIITDGEVNYSNYSKQEEITIGSKKGIYLENETKVKSIVWNLNGINYQLLYGHSQSKINIEKADMIQVAESFE